MAVLTCLALSQFLPASPLAEVLCTLTGGHWANCVALLSEFSLSFLFLKAYESDAQDSRFPTVWSISHPLSSPFSHR